MHVLIPQLQITYLKKDLSIPIVNVVTRDSTRALLRARTIDFMTQLCLGLGLNLVLFASSMIHQSLMFSVKVSKLILKFNFILNVYRQFYNFLYYDLQEKAVVEGAGASGVAAVLSGLLPELINKK